MKKQIGLLVGIGFLLLGATALSGPDTPLYHAAGKIAIGGEGFWDYLTVDSAAHRLYVTRGTHVVVIDTNKDAVTGDIPNTPGVHGVAVASKLNRGFTSNGRENTVTVFDLKTLKEIQRVPVGKNPDAILYDSATNRVFTFNGNSKDVTVLDALSGKVLGTIPVGGKPEFAATDEKGTVFCNVEDTSEIVALDAKTMTVKNHWPIAPGEEPSGLAFDKAHRRLFAVCGNKQMVVLDADSGKVLATPPIGDGPDACVFDAGRGLAVSSNGEGTLTVVKESAKNTFTPVSTIKTQPGARTMALDPKTHRLYLITASFAPPAAGETPDGRPRRPAMVPNSAVILIYTP